MPNPVPPADSSPSSAPLLAGPAISRCAQGRDPANSRRKSAAVMDPAPLTPPTPPSPRKTSTGRRPVSRERSGTPRLAASARAGHRSPRLRRARRRQGRHWSSRARPPCRRARSSPLRSGSPRPRSGPARGWHRRRRWRRPGRGVPPRRCSGSPRSGRRSSAGRLLAGTRTLTACSRPPRRAR